MRFIATSLATLFAFGFWLIAEYEAHDSPNPFNRTDFNAQTSPAGELDASQYPDALVGPISIDGQLTSSSWKEDSSSNNAIFATKPLAPLATAHPHGEQICASGCAMSRHPTPLLKRGNFDELISKLEANPTDTTAFDELLYYGPQTGNLLRLSGDESQLATSVRTRLDSELKKTHARIELRLVTPSGELLADLPGQIVPLDIRHEFDMQEHGIPPLVASGTVKRIGVDRLWGRL